MSIKLLIIIILISILGVLTSSIFVLTLQRQQLENSALATSIQEGNAVNIGLEHAMLNNDHEMEGQIVQDMVGKPGIDHIRVLDANGVVRISSLPAEIGKQFDYSQATCQFCHSQGARPSNQSTIIGLSDGHEALLDVNLIYNKPACQSCHDAKTQVLGITMVEMPLVSLNNQLADGFWRIAFSGLVTLGVLIALMTLAVRHLVSRPVDALARGMTEIRAGNLDYRLPPSRSRDELGELTETFETLRSQLKATRDENAELQKRTHSLAVLEERDRLAREMHDNLAQTLGYINLKASMADSQLVLNQSADARASLVELKRAVKEAYTDVRESIFNLRNAPASDDGLLGILTHSLVEYRAQCGIDAQLYIADERLAEFPVEVQVQVNRIIQESLTNTRKHSGASRAEVRFERNDGHVQICIKDNGKGFDVAELSANGSQHFGLKIMRERAESVGGDLSVESKRGEGTCVIVQVPIYPMIEDPHEHTTHLAS